MLRSGPLIDAPGPGPALKRDAVKRGAASRTARRSVPPGGADSQLRLPDSKPDLSPVATLACSSRKNVA